jgi:hypothetical protein
MELIQKAREFLTSRPTTYSDFSNEEVELFLAYIEGEVTFGQVNHALGRSYGYATNWCRRVTAYLFFMKRLTIESSLGLIKYKQPTEFKVPSKIKIKTG